ncbi:manganese catalase family protein [Inquilinus limosus]|uniref:manganese catalase family protein n=1 Tax=Inquilinus limosus TaxID=171674 RepID=UPI003F158956
MFLRIDRLQIELPQPSKADPNAAAALQELLGGKFGEMSTLNNYFFQSFNFRDKGKLKPFYSLVANITTEELGHVELVTNGVNLVARGPEIDAATYDVNAAPFAALRDARLTAGFFMGGGAALPADSMGTPWSGGYVFSTGNIILDLLHNFFLENGARIHKLRVYETVDDPVSREICGYLLVRGGVHAHAYALALKHLTGVDMTKMLPVPNIPTEKFAESRRYLQEGAHRRLYRFSPSDYAEIGAIWGNGAQALPGEPAGPLEVVDGPPDGGKVPDLAGISEAFTPNYQPQEIFEIANKLYQASKA